MSTDLKTQELRDQHYTIGVAGHIDHGKTTLTRALTGRNTDRLKEEQQRQISIELGFASFTLSNGKNVGVIDVPGHERFIRQMVAGVAGIDLVLLVIAADEGIMPQTKEHLDILHLLGITRGIIVLTKVDTVDEEFLELVKESVREDTQDTFLAESAMIEVDSLTGNGIECLKQEIEQRLSTVPSRSIQGIARLPVDRSFSKKGFGTIVTGTLFQGKIAVGDELMVLPQGQRVKIRNIQVHDQTEQEAFAGQRVAVNISDIAVDQLRRGDVLVTSGAVESTQRIDIEFHLLPHLDFPIKQRSPVRLHLGTAEVLGRLIFFDRNELQPGETCFAQLELNEPIIALFEDRFVLRRPTPMTTLGGGIVIDPYAKKHRFGQETIDSLAQKKEGDITSRAAHALNKTGVLTVQQLTHQLGISKEDWINALESKKEHDLKLIHGENDALNLTTTESSWKNTWKAIIAELESYHRQYPLRDGIDRKHIQSKYFPQLSSAQWNLILKQAAEEQKITLKNETIATYEFEPKLTEHEQQLWTEIQSKMAQDQIEVPKWSDLLPATMSDQEKIDFQRYLVRQGQLVQIEDGRYLSQEILGEIIEKLKNNIPETFSIQDVRNLFDTSRKYLIPFLEMLDRQGYTLRKDNERTWK